MHLLRELVQNGYTVIAVLHDLLLAQAYSDWIIFLKEGNIVASGPTSDVVSESILKEVYSIQSYQVFDPLLKKTLYIPRW